MAAKRSGGKTAAKKRGGKRETKRDTLAKITARAWSDPKFKKRLLSNPADVLAEYGINVPDGLTVVMHEDTKDVEHGLLMAPPKGLTPKELADPKKVHFFFCFTAFHHKPPRP